MSGKVIQDALGLLAVTRLRLFPVALALLGLPATGIGAQEHVLPPIETYTRGLPSRPGLLPAFFVPATGRLLLEVPHDGDPVLHAVTLSTGVTWPLDRGTVRLDHPAVVLRFQRIGDEVLVLEGSLQPPLVGDSFAALATLPLVARTGDRLLVDATDFIIRDAYGVAESLMWVGEAGTLDPERSSVVWAAATGSDHTTDIDVRLTFDVPGGSQWVERRSSHPTTLTVVQRHVFFRPSRGFRPRPASDHMGLHAMPPPGVAGMPTGGTTTGWVQRWRLPRPSDADRVSPHPITFYLEATIPGEHREAVRDGVAYWGRTLTAIGFADAVGVADLPSNADPLSLEYPVVLTWIARRQPLASMANLIVDPRTGEIVKAVVHLDARWPLVARNEYRAYRPALSAGQPSEAEYVHARIAFVVAHEAAHVIAGFAHTGYRETAVAFHIARLRSEGDRVTLALDHMPPTDPLPYDLWHTRYAYGPLPAGEEAAGLEEIVAAGRQRGLRYISLSDGTLMPDAVTRITTPNILGALREATAVRANLLQHFGDGVLDPGERRVTLYERLVPAYFHHRFALAATSRMLGGVRPVNTTDGIVPVPAEEQWRALHAVLEALSPRGLAIPWRIVALMPPAPAASAVLQLRGETERPDLFRYQTGAASPIDIEINPGAAFEPVAWGGSLASSTLAVLLDPRRAAQLDVQVLADSSLPTLGAVLDTLLERTWTATPATDATERRYERAFHRALLAQLTALAGNERATRNVKETVRAHLSVLRDRLDPAAAATPEDADMLRDAIRDLDRLFRPATPSQPRE